LLKVEDGHGSNNPKRHRRDTSDALDRSQVSRTCVQDAAQISELGDGRLGKRLHVTPWEGKGKNQLKAFVVEKPVDADPFEAIKKPPPATLGFDQF
jgi:hypothetical protein